jgi:hypothetical protein
MSEPEYVQAVPIEPDEQPGKTLEERLAADLERVRILAQLMDSQFNVLGIRFGMDAILGLLPVVGDTLALLPTVYPLMIAKRYKLGKTLQLRMGGNIAIDYVIGLIPVLGDIFDVASKANLKNAELLRKAVEKQKKVPDTR